MNPAQKLQLGSRLSKSCQAKNDNKRDNTTVIHMALKLPTPPRLMKALPSSIGWSRVISPIKIPRTPPMSTTDAMLSGANMNANGIDANPI